MEKACKSWLSGLRIGQLEQGNCSDANRASAPPEQGIRRSVATVQAWLEQPRIWFSTLLSNLDAAKRELVNSCSAPMRPSRTRKPTTGSGRASALSQRPDPKARSALLPCQRRPFRSRQPRQGDSRCGSGSADSAPAIGREPHGSPSASVARATSVISSRAGMGPSRSTSTSAGTQARDRQLACRDETRSGSRAPCPLPSSDRCRAWC